MPRRAFSPAPISPGSSKVIPMVSAFDGKMSKELLSGGADGLYRGNG
jgi:hypothetical protein